MCNGSMRRNVSLPDDLDQAAQAAGLSLSEVLQSAVRHELGHQDAPAARLERIEHELHQLVEAATVVLAISFGLAVLAGVLTWQARSA